MTPVPSAAGRSMTLAAPKMPSKRCGKELLRVRGTCAKKNPFCQATAQTPRRALRSIYGRGRAKDAVKAVREGADARQGHLRHNETPSVKAQPRHPEQRCSPIMTLAAPRTPSKQCGQELLRVRRTCAGPRLGTHCQAHAAQTHRTALQR